MGVRVVRVVRVAAAGVGLAALVVALVQSTGTVANFFSFFTVQSNILAVVLLLGGGLADPRSPRWAYFRGAVTLYMVITGIVYAVLLADVDVQLTTVWVNEVLHRILPLLLLADWLFVPPWPRIPAAKALGWLAFPVLYLAYSLLRGPIAHFYPYPFLDPRPHGYDHVIGYAVVLAIGMALLALAVWRIARLRTAQSGASTMSNRA